MLRLVPLYLFSDITVIWSLSDCVSHEYWGDIRAKPKVVMQEAGGRCSCCLLTTHHSPLHSLFLWHYCELVSFICFLAALN